MEDFKIMKSFKTSDGLDEDFPYNFLLEEITSLLVLANLLKNISIIRVFHNNTIRKLRS